MTFSITIVFVAVLALIQIPMTVVVGLRRGQTGIQFMDGGDAVLMRTMRAHANFTETVPVTILAMAAAEYAGMPAAFLWAGGLVLVAGRLVHYWTVSRVGWGLGRAAGMLMTLIPLGVFALYALAAVTGFA